jgi:class 3 adenylate cyclase
VNPVSLLIAFIDLTGWAAQAARVSDDVAAKVIDGWYEQLGATVAAAGGRTVKLIGDAALIVFPIDRADDDVGAMLALADLADAYFGAHGWDCRAHVKIHAGPCIAGDFGVAGDKRFDVIGRAVNACAMLDSTAVARFHTHA